MIYLKWTLSKTKTFGTGTKFPSYRESNKEIKKAKEKLKASILWDCTQDNRPLSSLAVDEPNKRMCDHTGFTPRTLIAAYRCIATHLNLR